MLTTYHTLRCITADLSRALEGRRITESFTQEKHRLHIAFENSAEHLLLDCTPLRSTLFLHPRTARARRNTATLLPRLAGRVIRSVGLHPSDRIVTIACEGGMDLHALLYGTRPNVLLADAAGVVLDAFREARTLAGTTFRLPPAAERVIDLDALSNALSRGGTEPVRAVLRTYLPTFGPDLLREAAARAGADPSAPVSALSLAEADALTAAVLAIARELEHPAPRVYLDGPEDHSPAFSLIPLRRPEGTRERLFSSVHEAVRFTLARARTVQTVDAQKDRLAAALSASCDRARRTAAALESELASSERSAEYERMGALLLAHAASIPRGAASAELEDAQGPLRITLDPARSALDNARRYFERAKSARRARREAGERLAAVRAKLERGAVLLEDVQALAGPEDLRTFLREHERELPSFGVNAAGAPEPAPLFRAFRVEGGFEVLAGRNSTNNDLLTLKHARPEDLWFHARGGSGSHVVLRVGSGRGEPGRAAREQAAAIAAHYSALRTSRLAPVAMTKRKYVRKPKGAPPGTVVIEREEVLFVTPGLPSGEHT